MREVSRGCGSSRNTRADDLNDLPRSHRPPQLFFSTHSDVIFAETVFGLAHVVFAVPDEFGRVPMSPSPPGHLVWRAYDTEVRVRNGERSRQVTMARARSGGASPFETGSLWAWKAYSIAIFASATRADGRPDAPRL